MSRSMVMVAAAALVSCVALAWSPAAPAKDFFNKYVINQPYAKMHCPESCGGDGRTWTGKWSQYHCDCGEKNPHAFDTWQLPKGSCNHYVRGNGNQLVCGDKWIH